MKESLSIRVERLERVVEELLQKVQKSDKYTHNMLEDLKAQMKSGFETDNVTDRLMEERLSTKMESRDDRLSRIELALATALGGMIVIAWLINHAANNIINLLAVIPK